MPSPDEHGRPEPLSDDVRQRMRRQSRRDTKPEMLLRRALHARGLRYRLDQPIVPGRRRRVDIVFRPAKVAVYVDGCFWHSCPEHATIPKNNRGWWIDKLAANVARDRDADRELRAAGWKVIRVWEHEDMEAAADRVEQAVRGRASYGDSDG